ncbi:MAG: amidase [Rubrivivax sp.]
MHDMVDFRHSSIGQLHAQLRQYRITPHDIAHACVAAQARTEPACQAWVCFDPDRLFKGADETAQRLARGEPVRLLEGIPVGVKDIFNTADFPTQMGSPLWAGFRPGNDARSVFHVKRAGGLVPGKTVTAEFAVHTLGKTLNPWARDRTPGTSSSGSAVAVAVGAVPAALGTQTAGSIIRPASFCGVWGMKPSFGLIPRTGMLKTTDSLDTVGFFAGHASDLRPLLDALRVHGRDYPLSERALSDEIRQHPARNRPWRVGVVRPHVWQHAPAYARQALAAWLERLGRDGRYELHEAELAPSMQESHAVHATIYNRALAYYFKEEYRKAELVSPVMRELIEAGNQVSPQQYVQALDRQVALAREMENFMQRVDLIVTLSTAGEAPLRGVEEHPDSALMWTLTQLPSISAPVFRSPRGLPFGLQLVARRYNDPMLIDFIQEAVQRGLLPATSFEQLYGAPVATVEPLSELAEAA